MQAVSGGGVPRTWEDVVALEPSDSARAYAERQFPNDRAHAVVFAKALTILERSERGAEIARALEQHDVAIEVAPIFGDMGGQYIAPFSGPNIGQSFRALTGNGAWPHLIKIAPSQAKDPRILAALLAHEGAHFDLTLQNEKNIPIRGGSGLVGAIGLLLSLPTLGMVDMNGNFHTPGTGAIASLLQGTMLVTSMTHENHAYRVGDAVIGELGGSKEGFVYDENGNERGALDGGWRIARSYMEVATETVTGKDVSTPELGGMLLGPALCVAAAVGLHTLATKVLKVPSRFAGYAIMGPGALLTAVAGFNLLKGGGTLFSQTTAAFENLHHRVEIENNLKKTWIKGLDGAPVVVEFVDDRALPQLLDSPQLGPARAGILGPVGVPDSFQESEKLKQLEATIQLDDPVVGGTLSSEQ